MDNNRPRIGAQRLKLVALVGLFAVPVVITSIWFANIESFRPSGTKNKGELITPAWQLQDFELRTLDGEAYRLEALREYWTLVYVLEGLCDAVCKRNLYHMRQVRLALGKEMSRVQRLLVLAEGADTTGVRELLAEHPGLRVTMGDDAELERFVGQLRRATAAMRESADAIYLVDPLGNLMLRFRSDLDPGGMLKDLQHLLKISRIG